MKKISLILLICTVFCIWCSAQPPVNAGGANRPPAAPTKLQNSPSNPLAITAVARSKMDNLFQETSTPKYAAKHTDGSYYFAANNRAIHIKSDGSIVAGFLSGGKFDKNARTYNKYGRMTFAGPFKDNDHHFGFVETTLGTFYLGEMTADGRYHGVGIFFEKDGRAYISDWSNGHCFSEKDRHYIE